MPENHIENYYQADGNHRHWIDSRAIKFHHFAKHKLEHRRGIEPRLLRYEGSFMPLEQQCLNF